MHGQSPDEGQLGSSSCCYAQALYRGPTPVPEAVRACSDLLAETAGAPTFEAGIATTLAGLRAMEGRFDEAASCTRTRSLSTRSSACGSDGLPGAIVGAQIETLAGDLEAAERELRTGYSMLEEMGEQGVRSTVAGFLAECSRRRGNDGRGGAVRRDRSTRPPRGRTSCRRSCGDARSRETSARGAATPPRRGARASGGRARRWDGLPQPLGPARSSPSRRFSVHAGQDAEASAASRAGSRAVRAQGERRSRDGSPRRHGESAV